MLFQSTTESPGFYLYVTDISNFHISTGFSMSRDLKGGKENSAILVLKFKNILVYHKGLIL